MIRTTGIAAFLVITFSASLLVAAAPQTLSKCTVQSKQVILQKNRPLRLTGVVAGRGTIEYHFKAKVDTSLDIKLTKTNHLKFDVYLLDPPTAISKGSETWSGMFSKDREYSLAINNCSGRTSSKFQIDVKTY